MDLIRRFNFILVQMIFHENGKSLLISVPYVDHGFTLKLPISLLSRRSNIFALVSNSRASVIAINQTICALKNEGKNVSHQGRT